jgi:hypothetical protein
VGSGADVYGGEVMRIRFRISDGAWVDVQTQHSIANDTCWHFKGLSVDGERLEVKFGKWMPGIWTSPEMFELDFYGVILRGKIYFCDRIGMRQTEIYRGLVDEEVQ